MSTAQWWRQPGALDRFVADLLYAEAQALRPGGPCPSREAFTPAATLGETGLGFDSLERLALAAALSEALFLHRGGLDDALVTGDSLSDWRTAALTAVDHFSDTLCFRSSGSTGPRRRHVHALAALEAEMAFFATILPGRRRVLTAIPCHHIYGFLFTLVLPARLHTPVIDLRARFPAAVIAALRPGDLVIGHPGFWSDLARAAPDGWCPDVIGVTSGAPCPDDLATAIINAGLSRLLQVYGASETAGIGWRDAPADRYRLLPQWRRSPDGTSLQRVDGKPVTPPDHLHWNTPDSFTPQGRQDQAVQVGGINVQPAHVRTVLRAHPAVADAAVRLMAPTEGSRLKAYIVPRDPDASPEGLREELALHVAGQLSPVERPRAYSFGPALPQTASGKPADWLLA
jgi:long-chain acyl-CoA synthetase